MNTDKYNENEMDNSFNINPNTSPNNFLYQSVLSLDKILQELATYEVCNGYMFIPKCQEDIIKFQTDISLKFNEFKRLIKTGECTLEFIEEGVLRKNGAFYKNKTELENKQENNIDNIDKVEKKEKTNFVDDMIGKMLASTFGIPVDDCKRIVEESKRRYPENDINYKKTKKTKGKKNEHI